MMQESIHRDSITKLSSLKIHKEYKKSPLLFLNVTATCNLTKKTPLLFLNVTAACNFTKKGMIFIQK